MKVLRYGVIYSLAAMFLITLALGGLWPLAVPAVVFGMIPLLDVWIGGDDTEQEAQTPLHNIGLWAWVPVQLALIAVTVAVAAHRSPLEVVVMSAALGIVTGAGGINIAHELVHRKSNRDRALAEILMTSVSYNWWLVEHVLGHHRWVATPRDPATSRLGETVYTFVPRSVFGGFVSFFEIEREYAARRGIRWWSLADRRTRYAVTLVGTYAGLFAIGGWTAVGSFAIQSAVAVLLLEVINYVEHYGLVRAELEPGRYERVAPRHSWNSTQWLTNAFLFNLQRHADHHAFASRPYWELRPWPDAPQLPLGYASMVVVALVPPLWFRWMNPRVAEVRA
jgi:alkane 1-monooxygenase